MSCQLEQNAIEQTVSFHGHSCPGLAIGMRASELALREMGDVQASDLVCVTETDMCGVDAIQYLTGCTYGKGNLLHHDFGKMAFSFYDRKSGKGLRLLFKQDSRGTIDNELKTLMGKNMQGILSKEEQDRLQRLRNDLQTRLMSLPLEELFDLQPLSRTPPRPARILESMCCEDCGEHTMESRTRRFAGKTLCIPCYDKVEQKR